jgi:hypothetical protein
MALPYFKKGPPIIWQSHNPVLYAPLVFYALHRRLVLKGWSYMVLTTNFFKGLVVNTISPFSMQSIEDWGYLLKGAPNLIALY